MTTNNTFTINYTDAELRNLVEEFLIQQKSEFSLKIVCSYVLYWAMEDDRLAKPQGTLLQVKELLPDDQDRVRSVLESIVHDGRIAAVPGESMMYKWVLK